MGRRLLRKLGHVTEPEPHMATRVMATAPRGKGVRRIVLDQTGMIYDPRPIARVRHLSREWGPRDGAMPMSALFQARRGHGTRCGDGGWRCQGSARPVAPARGDRGKTRCSSLYRSGRQCGLMARRNDYNGQRQRGVRRLRDDAGRCERWSGGQGLPRPAHRPGTAPWRGGWSSVRKMQEGRAVGVRLAGGRVIRARAEVVLGRRCDHSAQKSSCSVAMDRASTWQEPGFPVVADRAGWARTLQDHLELLTVQYASTKPAPQRPLVRSGARLLVGAQWLSTRKGLGRRNNCEGLRFHSVRARAWNTRKFQIPFPCRSRCAMNEQDGSANGHWVSRAHGGDASERAGEPSRLRSDNPADAPRYSLQLQSPPL